MNVMARFMLAKMAAEANAVGAVKVPTEMKAAIQQAHDIAQGKITASKKEMQNIQKTVEKIKPKSEKEKRISEISGRPFTKGQYKRYAALAGGAGLATHFAGRVIGGGTTPWVYAAPKEGIKETGRQLFLRGLKSGETMISPRQLTRAAVIGAIYGAMIPAARRITDIHAAKKGKF